MINKWSHMLTIVASIADEYYDYLCFAVCVCDRL